MFDERNGLDGVEILVDLKTGAIRLVVPSQDRDDGLELERVTADEPFMPEE